MYVAIALRVLCLTFHHCYRILLSAIGRQIVGGQRIRELPGHFCDGYKPEGFDTKNVFLSPSIRYAGLSAYAKPVE